IDRSVSFGGQSSRRNRPPAPFREQTNAFLGFLCEKADARAVIVEAIRLQYLAQSAVLTADEAEMIEIGCPNLLQCRADLFRLAQGRFAMASDETRYGVVLVPNQQDVIVTVGRHRQYFRTVGSEQRIADAPARANVTLTIAKGTAIDAPSAKQQRRRLHPQRLVRWAIAQHDLAAAGIALVGQTSDIIEPAIEHRPLARRQIRP